MKIKVSHSKRVRQAVPQVKQTLDKVFRDASVTVRAVVDRHSDPCVVIDEWLYIHSGPVDVATLSGKASVPGWLLTSAHESPATREEPGTVDIVEHAESQRLEDVIDAAAVLITKYRLKLIHEEEWCQANAQEPPFGRYEDHQVRLYQKRPGRKPGPFRALPNRPTR